MNHLPSISNLSQSLSSRREFLTRAGSGCGMLALTSALKDQGLLASDQESSQRTHHPPKVKSVIWLFMNGGPSGIDLFDHKPALDKWHDQQFPGKVETLFPHPGPIMRSPYKFQQYGQSGATVSEVYPQIAKHVDDITFLHACGSEAQNHVPACYMVNSGATRVGSPSVGSWVTYGLGSENRDLPGYVVMYDRRSAPEGGANLWDAGYLPGEHQAVAFRPNGQPILYLKRPEQLSAQTQKAQLRLLEKLNAEHRDRHPGQDALEARIRSLETAYRMQVTAPEIVDISRESSATRKLYGLNQRKCQHFGRQLLVARRMIEQGVRFIQVYHGGWTKNWDQHSNLEEDHRKLCFETDQPIAGLLADLKQRGLLDETLVVWGGEFGRGPTSQDRDGRDHNPFGFTMWMAGGGLKRGISYGQTDELGYKPVENAVSMHDLHATILNLLGLDHQRLTFRHNGREQSLTSVFGNVVEDILA